MSINTEDQNEPQWLAEEDEYIQEPKQVELGESINPKVTKAYEDLGMQVPDSPRLAVLRPQEEMKRKIKQMKGDAKETFRLTKVYRIRNRKGQEFLCYDYLTTIRDFNDNPTRPNQYKKGRCIVPIGHNVKDAQYNVVNTKIDGRELVYDIKWDPKEVQKQIDRHVKCGFDTEAIQFIVGNSSNSTRSLVSGKAFTIFNVDDFKNGKFEDLMLLGQRALSTTEPSLHKLQQPIEQDPAISLLKKGKMG